MQHAALGTMLFRLALIRALPVAQMGDPVQQQGPLTSEDEQLRARFARWRGRQLSRVSGKGALSMPRPSCSVPVHKVHAASAVSEYFVSPCSGIHPSLRRCSSPASSSVCSAEMLTSWQPSCLPYLCCACWLSALLHGTAALTFPRSDCTTAPLSSTGPLKMRHGLCRFSDHRSAVLTAASLYLYAVLSIYSVPAHPHHGMLLLAALSTLATATVSAVRFLPSMMRQHLCA